MTNNYFLKFSLTIITLLPCLVIADKSPIQFELKTTVNYRDSEEYRFPITFPFPSEALPVGQITAFQETVDEGQHFEISNISLKGVWKIRPKWQLLFKVDAIDLYDRNSTSQDQTIDLDVFMLRYGKKAIARKPAKETQYYLQIGKFEKFERQNDRHLQSYGLVSTAFNRFEDAGIEMGIDLGSQFYAKASLTKGNPVFIRDPNSLAGDNGIDEHMPPFNNPDPKLKSGIVILYDAEIEHFNLGKKPEIGFALGYRGKGDDNSWHHDIMLWAYKRNLSTERNLHGTFYGADIDILNAGGFSLPFEGNKKRDIGINYWLYWQEFILFSQYVEQDLAGLNRTGYEFELSYQFALPFSATVNGKPLIKNISPVLRYSSLDTDFSGGGGYPAPSVSWNWKKIDIGFNIDFIYRTKLTFEYALNNFETNIGKASNDEFLMSLNWSYRW
jgi:hypothetical protein